MQKLIGISAISAILILSIGILPPPTETETIAYTFDYDNLEEFNIDNLQEIELSIVETERVFTESDQSLIEQFLDENDLPSSSEKFGIEVQTVLFDSFQSQYPSSSILSIPALELTDSEGRLLDLGSIQTSFLGILSNSDRGSETTFNLDGTVKFYLDDTLIITKKLFASEQSQSKTHELSIVDSIPSFDRPKAFTFTLSDEGKDWVDGSEHTYRVVVTDINAELLSNNDIEKYSWNGEKIAYELKVKLDETKKVVLNENNNAVSIFKDDSTIQICGTAIVDRGSSKIHGMSFTAFPPSVVVTDTSGLILASVDFTPLSPDFGKTKTQKLVANSCSEKIDGIPRGTDVIFTVTTPPITILTASTPFSIGGFSQDYPIHTPLTQFNYNIDQGLQRIYTGIKGDETNNHGGYASDCKNYGRGAGSGGGSWACAYYYEPNTPTSNFGFPSIEHTEATTRVLGANSGR